jgi:WD40 repeat protein
MLLCVAFSQDSSLVAVCSHNETKIIDTTNWKTIKVIPNEINRSGNSKAVFSPDGEYIVTVCKGTGLKITNIKNWKSIFHEHKHWIKDIAFSPNNEYLAVASNPKTTCDLLRIRSKVDKIEAFIENVKKL